MKKIIYLAMFFILVDCAYSEIINYGFEKEWKSHITEINGLAPELENEFKFGALIVKQKKPILGKEEYYFIKKSTTDGFYYNEENVNETINDIFLKWRSFEHFKDYPADENSIAYFHFGRGMNKYNISVIGVASKEHYKEISKILSLMPKRLVENNTHFHIIKFGGNLGKNGAKISEYREEFGSINIFDFLLHCPKRLFTSIFIHELGHVVDETFLKPNQKLREELMNSRDVINNADAAYTFDFGMSREGRISYQRLSGEFIAENFMHYVLQGDQLRENIFSQKNETVKKSWCKAYNFYKYDVFEGNEFSMKTLINTTAV